MPNRNQILVKKEKEIYFKNIYSYLNDVFVYRYRKVNLQEDLMMFVVDYYDGLFQEYHHLFEQVHQEFLINQPK
jgi:hypothetical protein